MLDDCTGQGGDAVCPDQMAKLPFTGGLAVYFGENGGVAMRSKFYHPVISMMVLFTFLHSLFAGCTKTITVPGAQLDREVTDCCVQTVVLKTGETYEFKEPGGQYNFVSRLVIGTLNDGRTFYLDLTNEEIKEIRVSTEQIISRVELARNPDQTIYEITVGNKIYTFDQNGGRLQFDVETIRGITTSGDEMDVPIEDIRNVKLKQADPEKTGTAVGLGALGVILIAVAAAIVAVAIMGPSIQF